MGFGIERRQFVGGLALLAGGRALAQQAGKPPRLPGYPFTLGVAAGDPDPSGFVLWVNSFMLVTLAAPI